MISPEEREKWTKIRNEYQEKQSRDKQRPNKRYYLGIVLIVMGVSLLAWFLTVFLIPIVASPVVEGLSYNPEPLLSEIKGQRCRHDPERASVHLQRRLSPL